MSERPPLTTLVIDDTPYLTTVTPKFARRTRYLAPDPHLVLAHLPGVIQKIYVAVGQTVAWGDRLVVLEAMKMKNDVTAPRGGTVKALHASPGDMVTKGQLILELE